MARAFLASWLGLGEHVAVWAPNGIDWVIATLSLQLAGGVLAGLSGIFAGGRLPSSDDAAFAEDHGELAFGLTPLPRRPFPFVGRVIEHEV
jgi:acyl-CoA synthetase (AMP-forming)/AMP-acid ligase II